MIGALALHIQARDAQFRRFEVDVLPFERAQFQRSQEHERLRPQPAARDEAAIVVVNVEEQFASLTRIGKSGVMLDLRRFEEPAEIGRR